MNRLAAIVFLLAVLVAVVLGGMVVGAGSIYFAMDQAREDWHYRCDQYRYTKPTDPQAAQATACQREADALTADAQRYGWTFWSELR